MRSSLLLVFFWLALRPYSLLAQCQVSVTGGVLNCAQTTVTLNVTTVPQGLSWQCLGPQGQLYVSPNNPVVNIPGAYTVTVTDGLGCTNTATAFVTQNTSCFGSANGSIDLVVPGGGQYLYFWSNGSTTQDLSNLSANIYCVTVTDAANGCTVSACATVNQPTQIALTTTTSDVTCGQVNGSISLSVSGGSAPYAYDWADLPGTNNSQDRTGLAAGTYSVTVFDTNGCTSSKSVTVQQLGLDISSVVIQSDCPGATGSIDLTVGAGQSPYTYDWADLPGTNDPEDRSALASGLYSVTVSDVSGCSEVKSFLVGSNTAWTIGLATTNVSCFGALTGSINLTVNGSGGPFTFDWSNTGGSNDTEDLSGLPAGMYTVTVSDVNGCFNTASSVVSQPTPINITGTTNPSACLNNTGSIDISVSGGTPPYQYFWSNGVNVQDLTSLSAGTYCVTVEDANGCTATRCFNVTQTTGTVSISAQPILLNCGSIAQISATATGGILPYTYTWGTTNGNITGGVTTPTVVVNANGVYCVTVTDVGGCTAITCITVVLQPLLEVDILTTTPTCYGNIDGSLEAFVSGGTAPYAYAWSTTNNGPVVSNLAPGNYCVTVTDANGCAISRCTDLVQPTQLLLQTTSCDNAINGVVSGGTPVGGYTVVWAFNGAPQGLMTTTNNAFTIEGEPGEYGIVVADVHNCQATATVVIDPNPTPCTFISGVVKLDSDDNCLPGPSETGVPGWLVRAASLSGTFYAFTDANGNYLIRVDPGTYTVEIDPLVLGNTELCSPIEYEVTLTNAGDASSGNDFVVKETPICPELTISLNTSTMRRCFTSSYWLKWTNEGLVTAEDAYVTVALDPYLVFSSASLPFTNLGNNVYRFELGDVAPGAIGFFNIWFTVSCNATLGQTHCSTATIFPNGPCDPPSPQWSGAEVDVRSECASDSLHFILKNIGNGPMTSLLQYIVIEDGIMTRMGQSAPLAVQDSMVVSVPANGSTWRVEADQEAFFPGQSQPVLSVEGCSTSGSFSTGWVQQFATGAFDPWESINCTPNVGSYDPNDKQGFPLGYGPDHYIRPATPIEYLIRFQNTGTDTAFRVVIRDTLSPWLDPATVRIGAASHPYEFIFGAENVLVFDFQNILLPDSNVNQAGSQGFVQFRITPRTTAPLETVIENQAAIYFDFNEPVLTNTTQHRLGENFVTVSLWEPRSPQYEVRVSPNPLHSQARFEVLGVPASFSNNYRLQIFDLSGRPVQELTSGTPQFLLQKSSLSAGAYLFKVVTSDGQPLGNGRLVVVE